MLRRVVESHFIQLFFLTLFVQILIHMGLLADESGWKIAENAFSGGPLGELVQWADLISSLFVIGHDISFSISTRDLKKYVTRIRVALL